MSQKLNSGQPRATVPAEIVQFFKDGGFALVLFFGPPLLLGAPIAAFRWLKWRLLECRCKGLARRPKKR
jgi:hypothetical protein